MWGKQWGFTILGSTKKESSWLNIYTLSPKYMTTYLDWSMNLCGIPFLIHRVEGDIGPPFTVKTTLSALGRLP